MKDSSYLRGHRAFNRLKPKELEELAAEFSRLGCPGETSLISPGVPLEGIYLIEEGLCREGEGEEARYYSRGDILFGDVLMAPRKADKGVVAREACRLFYLGRERFNRWRYRFPRAVAKLDIPGFRPQGHRHSPLARSVLREKRLFWLVKSIPYLILFPLLPFRIMFRRRNGTFVEGTRLVCRTFRLKKFRNINLTIPLEQIQTVEIVQKGLFHRIMKTGDLLVRVNGPRGSVLIKNIGDPGREQERIMSLKRTAGELAASREEDRVKGEIAQWLGRESGIVLLEEARPLDAGDGAGRAVFGKSPLVLLRRGWWQLLLTLGSASLLLAGAGGRWPVFLPFLAFGASLCLFLYVLIDWLNDTYRIEEGYLLDENREPLGRKRVKKQVELVSIQNVITIQKGIGPNLFDYGTVEVIVPGRGDPLSLEGVKRPGRVQDRILEERDRWREKTLRREGEARREELKLYVSRITQELSEKGRL